MKCDSSLPTYLPEYLFDAHDLCLLNHDILVQMLRSAEETEVFHKAVKFRDDADRQHFLESDDFFAWLNSSRRGEEKVAFLQRSVFPALLSDFLHFICMALEASRRAKLSVCYALLRKPLQEHLALFEAIATDPVSFAVLLESNPLALRGQKAGGAQAHTKRIESALKRMSETDRFDAEYLAQLRYLKVEDGFDGICNHAMHLFTEHKAIQTEKLNVNFIFSDDDARLTQWYFLYSRLPYVLVYARLLIEYALENIVLTAPSYLANIERRVSASILLWAPAVESNYMSDPLTRFVTATRARLLADCRAAGFGEPSETDLIRMRESGGYHSR